MQRSNRPPLGTANSSIRNSTLIHVVKQNFFYTGYIFWRCGNISGWVNRGYIFWRCGSISGWARVGYIFRRGYIFGHEVPKNVTTYKIGYIFWHVFLATCPGVATFLVVTRRNSSDYARHLNTWRSRTTKTHNPIDRKSSV